MTVETLRRLLIGERLPTRVAKHQRLPKVLALPVFASDALSSTAYATEEILLVLSRYLVPVMGAAALGYAIPIAIGIATLLIIVTISYQQTIQAYPTGGGAYIVSRENLGEAPAEDHLTVQSLSPDQVDLARRWGERSGRSLASSGDSAT